MNIMYKACTPVGDRIQTANLPVPIQAALYRLSHCQQGNYKDKLLLNPQGEAFNMTLVTYTGGW